MTSNNVDTIYTIDELIEMGKENSLTLQNTNIFAHDKASDITYPIQNVFRDAYRPLLLRYCRRIELDDASLNHYKYNPKLMSFDLYGGVELWYLILWMNNMTSVTQFNRKYLILFNPNYLSVLANILNNEDENLYNNHKQPIETFT